MHAVLAEDADPKVVRFLIRLGADLNVHDNLQKWTALHFAARDQKKEIVEELLKNGAMVNKEDVFGNTPLWRVVTSKSPNLEIVKYLLEKGALPRKQNKHGVSTIDLATNMGNIELLKILQP
jgi:ankyrin repeat protein